LQFLLQATSPETFGYTLVYIFLAHWRASRPLEHIADGTPRVANVEPFVSVKVVRVQPDLDGLLHETLHVSRCRP